MLIYTMKQIRIPFGFFFSMFSTILLMTPTLN